MDRTERHRLSYVAADQAQKHVTVNEGLRMLDALVGASARSASLASEPDAPSPGEAYILPAAPSGAAWDGFAADDYVVFQDGAWAAFAPSVGLSVFVEDEGGARVWDGGAWATQAGGGVISGAPRFGVNADADDTNRLAVKSDAVLHSHDDTGGGTGDARHVLNKAAPSNTASFVFQTGYGGRAEIGLTGSDDFAFKVSPDGVTWHTALTIDRSTGAVSFPNTGGAQTSVEPDAATHEIWVVIGQSNALGRAPNADGLAHPAETYQYDQAGGIAAATTPLDHVGARTGDVGLDVGFAAAWHAAATAGSTLTFVPCAQIGTGFADQRWRVGDDLYQAAVARTNAALAEVRASRGAARLGGFLWLQGEEEAVDSTAVSPEQYEAFLTAMIDGLRAEIAEAGPSTPFVLAQMTPEFIAAAPAHAAIDAVHRGLPASVAFTALASNAGTAGAAGDTIHYDAASLDLIGRRMHAAVPSAAANAPAVPGRVEGLVAAAGVEGEVNLTYDAPPANRSAITDYDVRVDGQVLADGVSADASRVVRGLTPGRSYAFEVRAVNGAGAGAWSAVATAQAGGVGDAYYPDALGFWLFGADNTGLEEQGGGRALTLRRDAPTQSAGYLTLADSTGSNTNPLLTDLQEPATYTAWAVLRVPTSGQRVLFGALGRWGTNGGGARHDTATFNTLFRGNPTENVGLGPFRTEEWVFLACSLSADGQWTFYRGGSGASADTRYAFTGQGTRAAPSHGKALAIGNGHYGGTDWSGAFDVAEFGVLPSYAAEADLDALYAEAVARQADRGNAVS